MLFYLINWVLKTFFQHHYLFLFDQKKTMNPTSVKLRLSNKVKRTVQVVKTLQSHL